MTLNPPGAPACVRCNTPLAAADTPVPAAADPAAVPGMVARPEGGADPVPGMVARPEGGADPVPDPTEGSKRIGPGLSAAATGAPGSSRAQAAAVQPPGYGLDAGDPGPTPPPVRPSVEDPRVARRVALVGALLVVAVLVAGGLAVWLTRPRYVDPAAVQRQIADQLTARLGAAVAVRCPGDQRRRAGVTFRCTATDNAGGRRPVTVTVVDNSGKYTWTLGTA